jgi:hypothetical protein
MSKHMGAISRGMSEQSHVSGSEHQVSNSRPQAQCQQEEERQEKQRSSRCSRSDKSDRNNSNNNKNKNKGSRSRQTGRGQERSRTSIHLLVQELGHDLLQGGSVRCIKRQDLGSLGSSGATWTGHTDR